MYRLPKNPPTGMQLFYTFLFSIILLSSCTEPRYAYSPAPAMTTQFKSAGDGHINAALVTNGLGGKAWGGNFSAAYAVTKNIGLGVQHFTIRDGNEGTDSEFRAGSSRDVKLLYRRRLTTGALILFTPFGEQKKFFGELSFGYGKGRFQIFDTQRDTALTYNFQHYSKPSCYFIQPGIYYHFNEKTPLKLAFSARMGLFSFDDIATNYTVEQLRRFQLDSLGLRRFALLDPAFSVRAPIEEIPGLELFVQAGMSFRLSGSAIEQRHTQLNAGLNWSLHALSTYRKGKK
jgi:hypothetical protein